MIRNFDTFPRLVLVVLLVGCGVGNSGGAGGGAGTGSGGGAGGGGGARTGTPVTVTSTTMTTPIPVNSTNCSGSTLGTKGDLPATNVPVFMDSIDVTALTLRHNLGSFFGEPTRSAVVSWEGTGGLYDVQWLTEVHDPQGRQYAVGSGKRVFASYLVGTVKGPGEGFGSDTTGSPSWSQTFVTYDNTAGVAFGVPEADAKNIYKACFKLAKLHILKLNNKPALKP